MSAPRTEVPALLRAIREAHRRDGRKIARYFVPGLPDDQIHRLCDPLGRQFPEEWYDLYRTYDGVDPGDNLSLQDGGVFGNWHWFPLEHTVDATKNIWVRDVEYGTDCTVFGFGYYRLPWLSLPAMSTTEGKWPVICYWEKLKEMPILFDGIEAMLRTVLAYYDEVRGKDVDMRRNSANEETFRRCALDHNRNTNFWDDDRYDRWPELYRKG